MIKFKRRRFGFEIDQVKMFEDDKSSGGLGIGDGGRKPRITKELGGLSRSSFASTEVKSDFMDTVHMNQGEVVVGRADRPNTLLTNGVNKLDAKAKAF